MLGAMKITKTPEDTFKVRWREESGAERSRTFKTKALAVAYQNQLIGDVARGEYVAPVASKLTVAAWADEWLELSRSLGAGGRDTYRRDLDRHILPELGLLPLGKLTADKVDAYLSAKLEAGYAASTVHRHYRTIHRMCEVAVGRRRLGRNPCAVVEPPKVDAHDEMRFLAVAEVERLHAHLPERYKALVLVACYGGPRWSEMVGLRRSDVAGTSITIAGQLIKRADGQWHRDLPKTKAGRRTITLPSSVASALGAHIETYCLPGPDGLVFPNRDGAPLHPTSWNANVFKLACTKAKLGAVRPHDMRHTAVALAIAAGAHPKAIQARMGHASISITLDRYGHLFPEMDERIAEDLDAMRGPVAPPDE